MITVTRILVTGLRVLLNCSRQSGHIASQTKSLNASFYTLPTVGEVEEMVRQVEAGVEQVNRLSNVHVVAYAAELAGRGARRARRGGA